MKKAFLMVLACLLLAGCGAPSETCLLYTSDAADE